MAEPQNTPRGLRCVISFVGRCNSGKSSLINAICGQNVAIVSNLSGTTTDAVAKPFELLPFGPVTFYDTAGLDDESELGAKRIAATKKIIRRSDIAVLVCDEKGIGNSEKEIISLLKGWNIPILIVFNKIDISVPKKEDIVFCQENKIKFQQVCSSNPEDAEKLKAAIIEVIPQELKEEQFLSDGVFSSGDTVVLVTPLDASAPKGRLILPQVQVLREVLDKHATAVVTQTEELKAVLDNLQKPPAVVITDSQAFVPVAQIVPERVPLTSFSILFSRAKGELKVFVEGAEKLDSLQENDKVMIAEACSHHVQCDDIGRVKLPALLRKYTGKNLQFEFFNGHDFPDNLEDYALVVHCGACMFNRAEMINRVHECMRRGVAITNYGIAISKAHGILSRAIRPFNL